VRDIRREKKEWLKWVKICLTIPRAKTLRELAEKKIRGKLENGAEG